MVNKLIQVTSNEQGQQLVSGRELHEVLKVQQDFSDWIKKQLENVDATENEDFTLLKGRSNGGRPSVDYVLTLDIAKEICMCVGVSPRTNLETKALSKQVRKYFIECEKQLTQQVPQITAEDKSILTIIKSTSQEERMMALIEYKEIVTKPLVEKIELDAPKVDAFDTYMDKDGLYTVTNVSKLLNIKRKDLYQWLRDKELVYKRKCICTVKAQDLEIAKMKINNGHDSLYITPKGVEYIRNNFVKED